MQSIPVSVADYFKISLFVQIFKNVCTNSNENLNANFKT